MKKLLVLFISCFLFILINTGSSTSYNLRFVKQGGTGDGSSWEAASGDLQAMINASEAGDKIYVAAGTYKPTSSTDRSISFIMKAGVKIYGGYAGDETIASGGGGGGMVGGTEDNVSILSGDIGVPGDDSDNAYHVIFNNNNGLTSNAVLDGFTITGGNANETTFPHNAGGGIHNINVSPTISNCIIKDNFANAGGGMRNGASAKTGITGCSFKDNRANIGGAISNFTSSPLISSCFFFNNTANNSGGGISNINNCFPTIRHCTFLNNTANNGSGLHNGNSSNPVVENTILWDNGSEILNYNSNPVVTYSIVRGGYNGEGNLDGNPRFALSNDYLLSPCSPAVDAGKPVLSKGGEYSSPNIGTDKRGSIPDLRCYVDTDGDGYGDANSNYELSCLPCGQGFVLNNADCNDSDASVHPDAQDIHNGIDSDCNGKKDDCCCEGTILYVNPGANPSGFTTGLSWELAYSDLYKALNRAKECNAITQIWVTAGIYKPKYLDGLKSISRPFPMKKGLTIFGGFTGVETSLQQRDWEANKTILDGDVNNTPSDPGDDIPTVIPYKNLDKTAILNGFTIKGNIKPPSTEGEITNSINKDFGFNDNNCCAPKLVNCKVIKY